MSRDAISSRKVVYGIMDDYLSMKASWVMFVSEPHCWALGVRPGKRLSSGNGTVARTEGKLLGTERWLTEKTRDKSIIRRMD